MTGDPVRRGQPLMALALLMAAWIGARAALWENPFAPLARIVAPVEIAISTSARRAVADKPAVPHAVRRLAAGAGRRRAALAPDVPAIAPALPPPPAPPVPVGLSGAHQLAWMAVLAHLPMPPVLALAGRARPAGTDGDRPAMLPAAPFPGPVEQPGRIGDKLGDVPGNRGGQPAPHSPSRWSADGWLLLRGGIGGLAAAGLPMVTYGASQAGAVARYRLMPGSAARPFAYLRATAALAGAGRHDREAAGGLAARVPGLPLVAAAELRLAARPGGGAALRPAAFVTTELPPVTLPQGFRAEAYAQAGVVGGRGRTAFVDGLLRADRRLDTVGVAEIRAGAGLWGGAQQGVSRLDVGPAASVTIAGQGSASARLAMDWRFRVAGNAAPSSGPALTLSAGF